MNEILVTGLGAREHAIIKKLSENPNNHLYCAPGNPGIAEFAEILSFRADDAYSIAKFSKENKVDLVIPGPEVSLAAGVVDHCQKLGVAVFGPNQSQSRLETDKEYAKK